MARRFHLPALGSLLAQLGTLAAIVVKVPELTTTNAGRIAAGFLGILAIVQSMLKPVQQPPSDK